MRSYAAYFFHHDDTTTRRFSRFALQKTRRLRRVVRSKTSCRRVVVVKKTFWRSRNSSPGLKKPELIGPTTKADVKKSDFDNIKVGHQHDPRYVCW
ncbi:MAG TPA: hypothetical protein PLE32_01930 [Haliscomenobacter sp.]|nr:hypothetical protein [Haliscomenobacter sp.]